MLCQTHLTYFIGTQIEIFHRMSWLLFSSLKVGCVMPQQKKQKVVSEACVVSCRPMAYVNHELIAQFYIIIIFQSFCSIVIVKFGIEINLL